MPMSRYEIRNEYSLADPELYRAADKDDSEALLEGVAMAGLVGVLRQLGDLAEFAAEIFHDLHEEVLATAARGNGLMVRVQQLEAEVPSIEKAFLSRTDHSSFFNNAGVDWHPKQRMDQNLVTRGDLPRFVMDSYEECRGPPRLFLLDKFDVAGAGACLKRYTDPSFFKVETSAMTNADGHREKKNRKPKKRGPHWRNKGTSEVPPMSHAKFHHLLLKESFENGVSNPARRAKLKKMPHFPPFDSKNGVSYMGKLLKTPSPEHQMLREITVSSPLRLSTNDRHESDLEILEPTPESPVGEIKRSLPPDREEIMQNPLIYETNEETGEKDIPVDGESNTEGYVTGYLSDEVASEIDNFVDAPSTIESGMDTDSEMRVKNDFTSSSINNQQSVSVENEEHVQSLSSDSQSTGDLRISDDANSSSKKEVSSFLSSDPQKMSADIPEIAIVDDASSDQKAADEFSVDDEEKKINLIVDIPCSPSVSDINSHSGNDSLILNCENEPPRVSTVSDTVCHTKDSSAEMSDNLLNEDDYDHKDPNNLNNIVDNAEMIPTENSLTGELDDDVSELTENFASDDTDIAHNGDDTTSMLSRDEKLNNKLDNEDSGVFSDASNHSSCIMEASLGKELADTSLAKAIDAIELCSNSSIDNQVISETLISSPTENSPDLVEAGLDAHDGVSIPEDEITVNKTPESGNPESSEVVEVEGSGTTYNDEPNDFVAPEDSSCIPENLENPVGTLDVAAIDEVEPDKDVIGLEVNEIPCHEPSDESDSITDQSETRVMVSSSVAAVSDDVTRENVDLPAGYDNLVKEHISCFDGSGLDELENEKKSLSEFHGESVSVKEDNIHLSESRTESGLAEEVNASASDLQTAFCSTVNNDHLKLEVSHTVPNSYIDFGSEATQVQSPPEQRGSSLDTEEESFQQSVVENQVSDATSLPINCDTEETMLEKTELPPAQIDQELPSLLPINHRQILDHDDDHHENPASSPELPELRNYDIDISGYPKDDPSGFAFPPSNNSPFPKINQIDLDEPPLPPLPPVQWRMGKSHNASSITTTTEEEITKQNELSPQESDISFSHEETKSEEKIETIDLPLKIENEQQQQQLVMPTPESEIRSPAAEENGIANETRTVKLPQHSNPLIESVAVLDKSKLRKASERVRPQLQKVDDRDSLLEQIRAKSFNLKPAVASKPSIPGPRTNLNVAAILERANAIRQAFAGSDEDDEDNWSDS
ncbi:protein scar2 [Phtheirospermum japonicum]|uniref:Protein SCAR n=1 Tax=Phtheirospermum japonicum TaxID=374723 RepID=A0A830CW39_9LAMI|nr:protein scar2 [Phtheirospermum japonicum]